MHVLTVEIIRGDVVVTGPQPVRPGSHREGRLFAFADRKSAKTAADLAAYIQAVLTVQLLRDTDFPALAEISAVVAAKIGEPRIAAC